MDSFPHEHITIQPLYSDFQLPKRATKFAVGYDVSAYIANRKISISRNGEIQNITVSPNGLVLEPGCCAAIPLGFKATLPPYLEAQIRLRSSVAFRKHIIIPNAPVTIDPDYPDEWLVLVSNIGTKPSRLAHLETFAQIVFSRFCYVNWTEGTVTQSTDRVGGLGSTDQESDHL